MSKTDRFDTFQIGDVIVWYETEINGIIRQLQGEVVDKTETYLHVRWEDTDYAMDYYHRLYVNVGWDANMYHIDETSQVKRLLREYEGQS